jgi:hypothetical protein
MELERRAWLCIPGGVPSRLEEVELVDAERHLEAWIEADHTLLGDEFTIVGRQVSFEGGPADLIAVDRAGRFLVIEIKRTTNNRQDIAQALDYASTLRNESAANLRMKLISKLSSHPNPEEAQKVIDEALSAEADLPREVAIMLVGMGLHAGAQRVVDLLATSQLDVRYVSFTAHRSDTGTIVLSRDVEVEAAQQTETSVAGSSSMPTLVAKAAADGCETEFNRWLSISERAGLFARAYKHSVMLTPPQHHNSYLAVGRTLSGGRMRINHGPDQFAQWFPWVTVEEVREILGPAHSGMGQVLQGEALASYLVSFERLAGLLAEPPEGFADIASREKQWDRETFLGLFVHREDVGPTMLRLLDSVSPDGELIFQRAPLGQVQLRYLLEAPPVVQLSGRARLHGLWAMGTAPTDHPGWEPLKSVLGQYGGVGTNGGASGIGLWTLDADAVSRIVAAGRESSVLLRGQKTL